MYDGLSEQQVLFATVAPNPVADTSQEKGQVKDNEPERREYPEHRLWWAEEGCLTFVSPKTSSADVLSWKWCCSLISEQGTKSLWILPRCACELYTWWVGTIFLDSQVTHPMRCLKNTGQWELLPRGGRKRGKSDSTPGESIPCLKQWAVGSSLSPGFLVSQIISFLLLFSS